MISLHRLCQCLSFLVFFIFSSSTLAAAQPLSSPPRLTGEIYCGTLEGGFYGIIGDDGIKYQPLNLPRKFRQEGTFIKFDATPNDNIASSLMWGSIVELSNVSSFTANIATDERKAILVLLKRMNAFNTKDLVKLQQIDTLSKELTKEQFENWVGDYTNYTLYYVAISSASDTAITGSCYYTREMVNGMKLYGNIEFTTMNFTITQTPQGWKLTQANNLPNPLLKDSSFALTDIKKKALEKYKTDNLAALWQ